jgi:beta-fructofuranosidase
MIIFNSIVGSVLTMRYVLFSLIVFCCLSPVSAANDALITDFEQPDFGGWEPAGTAFGDAPGRRLTWDNQSVSGYIGMGYLHSSHGGRESRGIITSPPFRIEKRYINFLIAGGHLPGDRTQLHPKDLWGDECVISLLVDTRPVGIEHHSKLAVDERMVARWTTGNGLDPDQPIRLEWASWDLRRLKGQTASIRIVDNNTGPEGAIFIDQVFQSDLPAGDLLSNPDAVRRADAWIAKAAKHVQRQGFHFSPPFAGMSGFTLVHHKGWYHNFYLGYPHAKGKGGRGDAQPRLYFNHARSKDLVYWEDMPTAIWPSHDSGEHAVISGVVWVSEEGVPFIFYPSMTSDPGPGPEQWAAVGDANLIHWRKLPENPMTLPIPENPMPGGVDPFIFREGGRYYMGISGGVPQEGGGIRGGFSLFESPDLVNWKFVGIPFTAATKSWEEADFFKLGNKWVAIGEPYGPSQYFSGDYDTKNFKFTSDYHGYLDYAGVADHDPVKHDMHFFTGHFVVVHSFEDQLGRRINFGLAPAGISLPRVLEMRPDGKMKQYPVPELEKLRREHYSDSNIRLSDSIHRIREMDGIQLEIKLVFEPGDAEEFGIRVRCSEDGSRSLNISCDGETLQVMDDRTPARLMEGEDTLRLHIFVDGHIVEVFANDWVVYTELVTWPTSDGGLELFATGGNATVKSLDIWKMASIW